MSELLVQKDIFLRHDCRGSKTAKPLSGSLFIVGISGFEESILVIISISY